jgi:hypothetical protein
VKAPGIQGSRRLISCIGRFRKLSRHEEEPGLLDPGLLPIAVLPLGVTRGDAAAGGKVGTKGHQRSQDVQYVVPAI